MSSLAQDDVLAVLDTRAVAALTGHPEDREIAVVVTSRYRQLLPRRVHRIVTAVDQGDLDCAMDAALSLKVSSCMVGAGELHVLAARIESHLRRVDLAAAASVAEQLAPTAERTDSVLASYLA